MTTPNGQPEPPQQIAVGPLPNQWQVALVRAPDGHPMVLVPISTPQGDSHYFLDPPMAVQVGRGIASVARDAPTASGLVVPQLHVPGVG